MKRSIALLLLLATFFCYSQSENSLLNSKYQFQDDAEIITPGVDYSKIYVVFDEDLSDASLQDFEEMYPQLSQDRTTKYPWQNKKMFDLRQADELSDEDAESLLNVIRAEAAVLSAYPAFIKDNDIAFLDNMLLVNMDNIAASVDVLCILLEDSQGRILEELDMIKTMTFAVSVPADINIFDLCMELSTYEEVFFAQPNFMISGRLDFIPNDPKFSDQWFLNQFSDADIDAPEAWDITTGSSSIAVAVIDGHGYDLSHVEMNGKYLSPYNAVDDSNDPGAEEDEENHGTPCSGLIGALTNNSTGVAGVGYNTMVVPIKMGFNFGSGGTFSTTELILTRSCEHVMTSPYEIVAVSNSYTMGSWANIASIRNAYANMRTDARSGLGCVVLASTGNENTYNSIGYPFRFPHVLGVGSTDRFDTRSSFSNYGDSTDIAAPGTDTWTIDRTGVKGYSLTDYYEFGGTSAACPIAAGVVGLIASVNPGFTWQQLQQRLCSTCDKIGGYDYNNEPNYPYSTWNLQVGYGRVNAFLAVQGGSALNPPTDLQANVTGSDVHLNWVAPGGGGGTEEELIYDHNVNTGGYKYPGYTLSTHMSPNGPCQVIKLKYFTTNEGADNDFNAKVFNWNGSQPGTTVLYNTTQQAANGAWMEVDVSGSGINVTGDFVVGFGSFTEDAYIAYDADYDNNRSWDFQEGSQTWASWDEAYLIRAVVLYPDGKLVELGGEIPETIGIFDNNTPRKEGGFPGVQGEPVPNQFRKLLGLLGYRVYKNGTALNTTPISTTSYDDNGLAAGTYSYAVTAVYDEGESNPAGPVEAIVSGIPLDPPTNLQASVNGSSVNLSWSSPAGGSEEWIYYHDATFESSFASTDGGSGIAQLFTLASTPASLNEIRFFTTNYQNWDQPLSVYILSGDGSTVLGGPYSAQGANNNWVSITTSVNLVQSNFMIATYNDNADGPYVAVDDSYFDESLFFGNHTDGFTEMSQLGDYEYVGSHEAKVLYSDKMGRIVSEWVKPAAATKSDNLPDIHQEKEALWASYPSGIKALLGYNIYRDGTRINASTWPGTAYTDSGLSNGTYSYGVTAVYDEGESGMAGPEQVTVNATGLPEPTNLTGYASGFTVNLNWTGQGGSEEELIYDNGETTTAYNFPGFTMSTKMSPSGPCQVLTLKYLTSIDPGDNSFKARVFNWAGTQPGNKIYDQNVTAIEGWLEVDVSGDNLLVDGDFVVGFGSLNETSYLAFDENLNNGRSWDWDETNNIWSSWTEAYIIRAVVQYGDGTKAEISSSKGFLGYNLYRDNVKVNGSLIQTSNTTDMVPGFGTYIYNVTTVYDEGESAFSNNFEIDFYFGIDEMQQIEARIYPNPANHRVIIETSEDIEQLTLHSIDGKNVMTVEQAGTEIQLDVSKLEAGLYLLKLRSSESIGVFKLLVR